MEELLQAIYERLSEYRNYEDLYYMCKETLREDEKLAVKYLKLLSDKCEEYLRKVDSDEDALKMFELHRKVCLAGARYDFELYLLFVEWEREPKAKFYPPRRRQLHPIVEAMQELSTDSLDVLCISLPPGSGKSTLAIFYLTWVAGRNPNEPILTGSHSNAWTRGAYDECLRIMETSGEYLWREVFPGVHVTSTNAKDCRIDLDKRQRFETLEFTSIGTGNAGLYRAKQLLYCDDLVSGIEVALSKERLDKLWETYTVDLRQRMIGDHCKQLVIMTRWSLYDPIGRLEQMYGESDRAKFIVIPAMDENDESNFDYQYGVGFSTQTYREQREIMDDVSWRALYMNQPIEREGLLYTEDELQRYYELPDQEPDAIIAVCDTKDRGSDYCSMPIAYQYGQRYFIEDWVCDNSNPDVVEARLVQKLLEHHVHSARFESNSAGGRIAQKVQGGVKAKGGRTAIATKFTTANKETKIITSSGFVKEHFLFKNNDYCKKHKEYRQAMDMLCGYTMGGKNKHDDVPDSMAMLVDYIDSLRSAKVEIFARPW